MKRTISLTLALLMVISMLIGILAGCSGGASPGTTPDETESPPGSGTAVTAPDGTEGTVTEPSKTEPVETEVPTEAATEAPTEAPTEPIETEAPTTAPPTAPPETEPPVVQHTHEYSKTVTEPTCTDQGYTTYKCSCGKSYRDDYVKAKGHDYKSEIKAPTVDAKGYTLHTCKVCGNSYKDNYTDKLPPPTEPTQPKPTEPKPTEPPAPTEPPHSHQYTATQTVAPTCTAKGYTVYKCSCGASYNGDEKSALGHNYKDTVVPPTASSQGYTEHTCGRCGHSYRDNYVDKIAEHEHFYEKIVECVNSTCTKGGYLTVACACGATIRKNEKQPLGHKYEVIQNDQGQLICECTRCGHISDEIPQPDVSQSHAAPEVVELINKYRAENGLPPLAYYSAGQDFANLRAAELAVYFDHRRPNGGLIYEHLFSSECIASGCTSTKMVVDGWMASTGHRNTILRDHWTYATAAYNGHYWVVLFGFKANLN